MQFTSALCVIILTATSAVSAAPAAEAAPGGLRYGACDYGRRIGCSFGYKREAAPAPAPVAAPKAEAAPGGLRYGACDYGRRIGCSFGYKREAAPEAAPGGLRYGACDYGRRIGCSFGYKRDTVDEHIHNSYKKAAAGLASALTVTDGVAKRSPVADFCHSESGPCTLAARSADALAKAVSQENPSPEDYYHSLALGDVFAAPEGSEKRDITEITKREAEAFCNTEGQACHVAKRAAEAVAEAFAEANSKAEAAPGGLRYGACDYGRRIGCSFGYKRNADQSMKSIRSAEAIHDAAKAML